MKKLIIDIIEVYIPNAWFRVKCFFNPNILKELKEFEENFKRSVKHYGRKWIEDKIKLLLVMQGYDREKIKFRGEKDRYIMYGYWNHINHNDLEYVTKHTNVNFETIELEDSDCGWLFAYDIKKRK